MDIIFYHFLQAKTYFLWDNQNIFQSFFNDKVRLFFLLLQ